MRVICPLAALGWNFISRLAVRRISFLLRTSFDVTRALAVTFFFIDYHEDKNQLLGVSGVPALLCATFIRSFRALTFVFDLRMLYLVCTSLFQKLTLIVGLH